MRTALATFTLLLALADCGGADSHDGVDATIPDVGPGLDEGGPPRFSKAGRKADFARHTVPSRAVPAAASS